MNHKFKISMPRFWHGLYGNVSNRALREDRELFKKFVRLNCQLTGPTRSISKRSHGPMSSMNACFCSMQLRSEDVTPCNELDSFNKSLLEATIAGNLHMNVPQFKPVAGTSIKTWMKGDSGSRMIVDGVPELSEEYTTIKDKKAEGSTGRYKGLTKKYESPINRLREKAQSDRNSERLGFDGALSHRKAINERERGERNQLISSVREREQFIKEFSDDVSRLWFNVYIAYRQYKPLPS